VEEVASSKDVSTTGVSVRFADRFTPFALAVIVTGVEAATLLVVMANVPCVAPAAIAMLVGTVAKPLSEVPMATVNPPAGAGPLRLTRLPVSVTPPGVVEEARVTEVMLTGLMVSVAVRMVPLRSALMITGVATPTVMVVISNTGETAAPLGTVTLLGTDATAGSALDNNTTTPDGPAGPLKVTLLLPTETPPATDVAPSIMELRDRGLTVRLTVRETPFKVAEIATVVTEPTPVVVIGNVGDTVAPAATVIVAGTAAIVGSELESVTTVPPTAAGPFRVTLLPFSVAPPPTAAPPRLNTDGIVA
jgi:hypothetical protein